MIGNASKFDIVILEFDTCLCVHGCQNQHRDNNKCCNDYYQPINNFIQEDLFLTTTTINRIHLSLVMTWWGL
jgi:hypothetical protein